MAKGNAIGNNDLISKNIPSHDFDQFLTMKSVNVLKKSHFIDCVKFLFKTFSDTKKLFFLEIGIFKKKKLRIFKNKKNWECNKKIGNK